jgi:Zn-finger nucleic acid-binding protein
MIGVSAVAAAALAVNRARETYKSYWGAFDSLGNDFFRAEAKRIKSEIDQQIEAQARHQRTSNIACPECGRACVTITIDEVDLDYCLYDRGFWFDDGELAKFTRLLKDVPGKRLRSRASRFACPICGDPMREFVFRAPFNLLVDACEKGHGVYLENGEFDWALKLAGEDVAS